MRPALQRLLQRPSSVELLRYLVGTPPSTPAHMPSSERCLYRRGIYCKYRQAHTTCGTRAAEDNEHKPHKVSAILQTQDIPPSPSDIQLVIKKPPIKLKRYDYGPWLEKEWTRAELEDESNVEEPISKGKLLSMPRPRRDLRLWAFLLDYRQRIYADEGIRMFWQCVKSDSLELPVTGVFARKLWKDFLNLGFKDNVVLLEIWNYANQKLESTGKRWPKLYTTIIQHMLLTGRGGEAKQWHNRLIEKHPPTRHALSKVHNLVVSKSGDMEALAYIHKSNNGVDIRNLYEKIIPALCQREEYILAFEWHFLLLRNGDNPRTAEVTEPLVQFLAIYYPSKAAQVTASLVKAGVSYAPNLALELKDNTKISREVMNLAHGHLLKVQAKEYDDNIGARWFASGWVSLDIAISAILALGFRQIGPLSLQAIALREADVEKISARLDQLHNFNISIGESIFSQAIEKFARDKDQELLDGLLSSDQHPDELENRELQEKLLLSYSLTQDWPQWRRTLAITLIGKPAPRVTTENIILRGHARTGNTAAVLSFLRKMQLEGTPVMPSTISRMLDVVLVLRRSGRRPVIVTRTGQQDHLTVAINILKGIVESGSYVFVTQWREIVRRLGMLGRFNELSDLLVLLASWYGPANRSAALDPETKRRLLRYQVPKDVPTSHPLHPLRVLFTPGLQAGIVEWGFIRAMQQTRTSRSVRRPMLPQVTAGIELLKKLHGYGVHVKMRPVRRAIFNRLVIYYGPGRSNRLYNRVDRARNPLSLRQMEQQINMALGRPGANPRLREIIYSVGNSRLQQRTLKQKLLGTTRDPQLALSSSRSGSPRDHNYLPINR